MSTMLAWCLSACLAGQAPPPLPPEPAEIIPGRPSALPLQPAPAVPVLPLLPGAPIAHAEFARMFQPAPGAYEVTFIHPCKGCPVKVCFSLPPGCARVSCTKRTLTFDYGDKCVTIRFKILCGGVVVTYR